MLGEVEVRRYYTHFSGLGWSDELGGLEGLLCEVPSANDARCGHSQDSPRDSPCPEPYCDGTCDRPVGPAVEVPFPCRAAFVRRDIADEEQAEDEGKEGDGGQKGCEEDGGRQREEERVGDEQLSGEREGGRSCVDVSWEVHKPAGGKQTEGEWYYGEEAESITK